MDLTPDGIIKVDLKGEVTSCNKAFLEITGYSKDEIIGKHFTKLPTVRAQDISASIKFFTSLLKGKSPGPFESEWSARDGTARFVETHATVMRVDGRIVAVMAVVRDMTERKRREERICQLNEISLLIRRANELILDIDNEQELLNKICRQLVDYRNYKLVWIGLTQDNSYDVLPVAQYGLEKGYFSSIKITWDDSEHGQGPTGTAIKSGRPSIMRDITNDPQYRPWREQALKRGYRSSIALPLVKTGRNRVVGALNVYSARTDAFDEEEVGLLKELAGDISVGIEKIRAQNAQKRTEQQLRKSEEGYRAVFENSGAATQIVGNDGTVLLVNQEFERLSGYSKSDVEGKRKWTQFAHPDDLEKRTRYRDLRRIDRNSAPKSYETRFIGRNGNEKDTLFTVDIVPGSKQSVASYIDITELKQAEEALRQSEEKLRLMFNSVTDGITVTDLKGNIEQVNEAVVLIHGYQDKKDLTGRNALNLIAKKEQSRAMDYLRRTLETGASGTIEYTLLRADGSEFPGELSAALLKDASSDASGFIAITRDISERKKAEQEQKSSTDRLLAAMQATIQAMTMTTEKRDPYTAGHQRRVSDLACAIAEEMGLTKDQIEGIRMTGLVHDMGKISVPAEILSKPGSLIDVEYSMIQLHPQAGYDILKSIEFPWPIAETILQHHERLDGSGYPRNLSGEDILPEARILAVADVIEAMASHRPYRPALGITKALAEISKKSGILYDANVVTACLRLFKGKRYRLD